MWKHGPGELGHRVMWQLRDKGRLGDGGDWWREGGANQRADDNMLCDIHLTVSSRNIASLLCPEL